MWRASDPLLADGATVLEPREVEGRRAEQNDAVGLGGLLEALEVAFLTTALSLAPVAMPRPIQRVAQRVGRRLAAAYRSVYESGSDTDLSSVPYYEALRCLLELNGVVSYHTTMARGLTYDSPRPTWDAIADQMVTYGSETRSKSPSALTYSARKRLH